MPSPLVATIVGITGAAAAVAGTTYGIVAQEDAKKTAEANQAKALALQEKALNAAKADAEKQKEIDLANALAGIEALRASLMGTQAQAQPQPAVSDNTNSMNWPLLGAGALVLVALAVGRRK